MWSQVGEIGRVEIDRNRLLSIQSDDGWEGHVNTILKLVPILLLTCSLVGCGGSGGSSQPGAPPTTSPPPPSVAIRSGVVVTDFGQNDRAYIIKQLSGGDILLAGDTYNRTGLARYKPDGKLDSTFGVGGITTTSVGPLGSSSILAGLEELADGKLFLWGAYGIGPYPSMSRLTASGILDTSYGAGGISEHYRDGASGIGAIEFVEDNKIIATILARYNSGDSVAINRIRYNQDGTIDWNWESPTKSLETPPFKMDGQPRTGGIKTLPTGETLFLSMTGNYGFYNFSVARANLEGRIDQSFGTAGVMTIDFGGNDYLHDAEFLEDGRILMIGATTHPSSSRVAMAKLTIDGALDATFGRNGLVIIDSSLREVANAAAIQPDGKILLVGYESYPDGKSNVLAYRLHSNGELDASFGGNGRVAINVAEQDVASNVSLAPDGAIYIAGHTGTPYSSQWFLLAKLTSNGTRDRSFGD